MFANLGLRLAERIRLYPIYTSVIPGAGVVGNRTRIPCPRMDLKDPRITVGIFLAVVPVEEQWRYYDGRIDRRPRQGRTGRSAESVWHTSPPGLALATWLG